MKWFEVLIAICLAYICRLLKINAFTEKYMLKSLLLFCILSITLTIHAQSVFFSEDFESPATWVASDDLLPNFWIISPCGSNGPGNPGLTSAYISYAGSTNGCGQAPGNTLSGGGTLMATYSTEVDASCFSGLSLDFDYIFNAGASEIAQLMYSTNGGASWTLIGSNLSPSPTWTTQSVALPGALNASTFLLGFRFTYDNLAASGTGFQIDNLEISGTGEPVPPVMTCLGSANLAVNNSCQAVVGDHSKEILTLSDNCTDSANILVTQSIPQFTILPIAPGGSQVIILTATDQAGNSTTCSVTLNIIDEDAPIMLCPPDTNVYVDNACNAVLGNYLTALSVSDNCTSLGNLSLSQSPVAGTTISGAGILTPVTLTATDASGNSNSCILNATTVDTILTTIACPADSTVYRNAGCQYVIPDFTGDVLLGENCVAPGSLTVTQNILPGSTVSSNQVITLTVSGGAPNPTASCSFTLLLTDTISPNIACPSPVSVYADVNCSALMPNYTSAVLMSDNCGGTLTINQSPAPGSAINGLSAIPVTLTVSDASGNQNTCSFNQFLIDTIAPQITCPGNQSLPADANCGALLGNYIPLLSASDNCSGVILYAQNPVAGTLISTPTTVILSATDASGNTRSCSINVTIVDGMNPTISCPTPGNIPVDANCEAVLPDYTGSVVVTDNCTAPGSLLLVQSPAAGTVLTTGTQNVTLTVSDQAGNSANCVFSLGITDQSAPVALCPPNQLVYADAACTATITDYTSLVSANDNCTALGALTIAQTPPAGTSISGDTPISIQVTDGAANLATCSFYVLLIDTINPIVSCPGDQLMNINANCEFTVPDLSSLVGGSDNCTSLGSMTITQNPPAGLLESGLTPVLITLTDAQGNGSTCWTNLLPIDNVPPTITCPNPAPVDNGTNCTFILPDYGSSAIVLDNCSSFSINQVPAPGSSVIVGSNTIQLTVIDAGGNSASCTFDLSVLENEAPVIICPASIAGCNPLVTYNDPTFSDNCAVSVYQSDLSGLTSGMSFPVGITALEYTAVDSSGNTQTCSFTVEVFDYPAPAVIAEDTISLCAQTSLVINADPIASGTGLWTLESGFGTFNNQFANQTGVNNLGTGVNVFVWTVSSAACGFTSDTLVVINSAIDLPASTQDTIISCAQSQIILEANAPLYGQGMWTTNGSAVINDIHSPSTQGYLNNSGWQYFVWTISNGACPETHDTVFVLGNLKPEILTSSGSFCLEELPLSLAGSPPEPGISTYWSISSESGVIADPGSPQTTVDELSLGVNRLIYSSAYPGCPTVADTLLLVGELCDGFELVFPTVITPNFDGSNDLFVINNLEKLYPSCQVTIFNRWGSVVFESTGYEHPWDGTHKGEALPMGTYFYKIELNDQSGTVYRGDISIIH